MKLLFIADIVGSSGREAVKEIVPRMKQQDCVEFVIANGENVAGGMGITPTLAGELFACGVDVITTGNHVFKRKEIINFISTEKRLLRPANYPSRIPGKGWGIYSTRGNFEIAVVCMLGQVFIEHASDPVECIESLLSGPIAGIKTVIVDFHAEATAEKISMWRYLNGRITALIGTHTHVQTADETVSDEGTAFVTDAGMTGAIDSVIGMDVNTALKRIITGLPQKFKPAKGDAKMEGVILDINCETGKCISIKRIRIPWKKEPRQSQ